MTLHNTGAFFHSSNGPLLSFRGTAVLVLFVFCICFLLACVMYLYVTREQVWWQTLLLLFTFRSILYSAPLVRVTSTSSRATSDDYWRLPCCLQCTPPSPSPTQQPAHLSFCPSVFSWLPHHSNPHRSLHPHRALNLRCGPGLCGEWRWIKQNVQNIHGMLLSRALDDKKANWLHSVVTLLNHTVTSWQQKKG